MNITTIDLIIAVVSLLVIGLGVRIATSKPVERHDESDQYPDNFDPEYDHHLSHGQDAETRHKDEIF